MCAATIRPAALAFLGLLLICACDSPTGSDDADDGQAPAPITDLAIASFSDHSVTLTWTAVGDDGNTGTAARYEVRGSTAFIEPRDFGIAVLVPGVPRPGPAGTTEEVTVEGLDDGETYFFAMTVFDEEGNSPGVSNCVSATCFDDAVVQIPDGALEAAVRAAIGQPEGDLHRSALRALRELDASGAGVANLAGLEECINLEILRIPGNEVVDLAPLAGLTALFDLDLTDNRVSSIGPLAGLHGLRYLRLAGNAIVEIATLAELSAIEGLTLGGNQIADLGALSGLTQLSSLGLEENQVTDVSPLASLQRLEMLTLRENEVTDVTPLAGLVGLVDLDLTGNPVADFAPLATLTALEHFFAYGTGMSDSGFLQGMTGMRMLGVANNQLAEIAGVTAMTQLRFLIASGNQIGDLSPLAGKTDIVELHLHLNQISDLAVLADLEALEVLQLAYNQVQDLSPLVANAGLGTGDRVFLQSNPLLPAAVDQQIPALRARGVLVEY